jgi:polyisoprenoid-binding protein YceI
MVIKLNLLILLFLSLITAPAAQTKKVQADKKESSVTYQLTHPLHEIESTSKDVNCWVDVDPAKKEITHAYVQIDVTTFNSGNSNRDSHAMEVIDAISYPNVKFTSTSITKDGDKLKMAGGLTFHGVTKSITFDIVPKWDNNKLTVTGNFVISLTEFKVERPSLLMIPVKDELKFLFTEVFNL